MSAPGSDDTFPRQYARTRRLTLGEPRNLVVSPDGQRIVFIRSRAGDDPINCLYVFDVATGDERLIADPLVLLTQVDPDDVPAEERARRERMRETASGVTTFATDKAVTVVAFPLSGRLFVAGLVSGVARELVVDGPVFDPRPDPVAGRLAYLCGNALRIAELDGSTWELASDDDPNVSWGAADFIAAEEIGRNRGYWWCPDGSAIAACRVDVSDVGRWYISDPADPSEPPREVRYPAAGTTNATVGLQVLKLDGGSIEVAWDQDRFPYLVAVNWVTNDRLLLAVQSRDQRDLQVLEANPTTGDTAPIFTDRDDCWVEIVPGTPDELSDGRLVMAADRDGARRLLIDGQSVTPVDLQVRTVLAVGDDTVLLQANDRDDATMLDVWQWSDDGLVRISDGEGVHSAVIGGPTTVLRSTSLDRCDARTEIVGGPLLASYAEAPLIDPNVSLHRYGERRLATALLMPRDHDGSPLPVLLDPYAGPHVQYVLAARGRYALSQWFADQGFAVVIIDGRGTPGRGSEWERAVHLDLASAVLDDQVDALHDAAQEHPLDLSRVAIRGWSFGGYLAALAVMRRPDVFHAAIAGAPVTDWRLYDTHYTERYLGDPTIDDTAYANSSLLPLAGALTRPLLLIHGLADDNVVAAHTLQLSSALLAAGKAHEVLPLVGVTHMTPQEVVAENILLYQLDFLRRFLATATSG
ncbi:MAG TPA: prolyl oligopeptidase family serine peptidase [Ilumatobacteraceae bacterium]|nr:prolyl oligopeptidase family serine peptidase [Ilumatobacteraceae bacterium]